VTHYMIQMSIVCWHMPAAACGSRSQHLHLSMAFSSKRTK